MPTLTNTRKKITALMTLFWGFSLISMSSVNAEVLTITTSEGARKWTVNSNSILEVVTTTTTGVVINSNGLDPNSLKTTISGPESFFGLDILGDVTADNITLVWGGTTDGGYTTQLYEFSRNFLRVAVTSVNEIPINIESNLGSNENTVFTTIGGKHFSYKKNGNNMDSGPIFLWEFDGVLTNPTIDTVQINKTGTSLNLQLYVYAHDITENLLVNRDDYLQQFALFAAENIERTDTFIYVAPPPPPPAPAPAPAVASVRKSSNLQFNEALYGSDNLSDPDGQLRKTVDAIDAKYGNLIK